MAGFLVKLVVFIVNIVLWVCGILLIVFGSIALGSPKTIIGVLNMITGGWVVINIIDVTPMFEGVAIFMIVLGSIVFVFGFIGCHGAFRMNKRMVRNYWILLILGLLTETALIIYAALFPPTMDDYVQRNLYESLITTFEPVTISADTVIYSGNVTASSWEMLQSQTRCCGVFNYSDYSTFEWDVVPDYPEPHLLPPTCCKSYAYDGKNIATINDFMDITGCLTIGPPEPGSYNEQGCWLVIIKMVYQFNYISIGLSASLMVAQLVGIILTGLNCSEMDD